MKGSCVHFYELCHGQQYSLDSLRAVERTVQHMAGLSENGQERMREFHLWRARELEEVTEMKQGPSSENGENMREQKSCLCFYTSIWNQRECNMILI